MTYTTDLDKILRSGPLMVVVLSEGNFIFFVMPYYQRFGN